MSIILLVILEPNLSFCYAPSLTGGTDILREQNTTKRTFQKRIFVRIITLNLKRHARARGPEPVDNSVDNLDPDVTNATKIVMRHARETPQNVSGGG